MYDALNENRFWILQSLALLTTSPDAPKHTATASTTARTEVKKLTPSKVGILGRCGGTFNEQMERLRPGWDVSFNFSIYDEV